MIYNDFVCCLLGFKIGHMAIPAFIGGGRPYYFRYVQAPELEPLTFHKLAGLIPHMKHSKESLAGFKTHNDVKVKDSHHSAKDTRYSLIFVLNVLDTADF